MIGCKDFPVALTFDIDWAPDCAVEACIEILKNHSIPATFFITHQSNILDELVSDDLFEVGIHPNFLPGTTHGKTYEEILDTVMNLVPHTFLLRTHGLFQSTNLFFLLLEKYPQIKYDFSLFLPENKFLKPFKFYNEKNDSITKVPYQWEDDLYFSRSFELCSRNKEIVFDRATYQIFDFHPIHIYLNSQNSELYNKLKQALNKPLHQATFEDLKNYRNPEEGAADWLYHIIETVSKDRFVHASQIPAVLMDKI